MFNAPSLTKYSRSMPSYCLRRYHESSSMLLDMLELQNENKSDNDRLFAFSGVINISKYNMKMPKNCSQLFIQSSWQSFVYLYFNLDKKREKKLNFMNSEHHLTSYARLLCVKWFLQFLSVFSLSVSSSWTFYFTFVPFLVYFCSVICHSVGNNLKKKSSSFQFQCFSRSFVWIFVWSIGWFNNKNWISINQMVKLV